MNTDRVCIIHVGICIESFGGLLWYLHLWYGGGLCCEACAPWVAASVSTTPDEGTGFSDFQVDCPVVLYLALKADSVVPCRSMQWKQRGDMTWRHCCRISERQPRCCTTGLLFTDWLEVNFKYHQNINTVDHHSTTMLTCVATGWHLGKKYGAL